MIGFLRGRVATVRAGGSGHTEVIVDVGGVGYRVLVPTRDAERVGPPGGECELHTSLQVREDSLTLYGFANPEARDVFEALLSASGVGPRLALSALGTHPPTILARAVADEDHDTLTVVPGIGDKVARRLVLELKDRLAVEVAERVPATAGGPPGDGTGSPRGQVRLALLELGYSRREANRALAGLTAGPESGERADEDVGELLRTALKSLDPADRT